MLHPTVALALIALSGTRTVHADGGHAVGRVRPVEAGPTVSLALLAGYGYTGAVLHDDDRHHRAQGAVALAVRARPWLELGGSLTGRYDQHTGASTDDDGLIGDPRLWLTAGRELGGGRAAGLRLGVWLPGADAPSVEWAAVSVDASAVFTLTRGATALTASAGFRLDRSTAAVDAASLSRADRLGLGLSDANAAIVGLGVVRRAGPWQLVGELSGDLLVGAGAPPLGDSPLRVGVGVRRALDSAFTLEALVEVSASQRPDGSTLDPSALVAVEPRAAIGLGLSWHPAPARPRVAPRAPDDPVVAPADPSAEPSGGVDATVALRGTIVDERGAPLPDARVTIGALTATTGDDGRFVVPGLAPGPVEATIARDGYQPETRTLTAGSDPPLAIGLARIKPPSQVKALIRGFDGQGLAARVRIEPVGIEVTAGADGRLIVDLAPGTYTLVIELDGYRGQRKTIVIEEDGVAQPNIELQRARR